MDELKKIYSDIDKKARDIKSPKDNTTRSSRRVRRIIKHNSRPRRELTVTYIKGSHNKWGQWNQWEKDNITKEDPKKKEKEKIYSYIIVAGIFFVLVILLFLLLISSGRENQVTSLRNVKFVKPINLRGKSKDKESSIPSFKGVPSFICDKKKIRKKNIELPPKKVIKKRLPLNNSEGGIMDKKNNRIIMLD